MAGLAEGIGYIVRSFFFHVAVSADSEPTTGKRTAFETAPESVDSRFLCLKSRLDLGWAEGLRLMLSSEARG